LCISLCFGAGAVHAQAQGAATVATALDARLAGDAKQTRFVLDLDHVIKFKAYTMANPYRVVVDTDQINFQLPDGSENGRGLVKKYRYGLVTHGSRIMIDLAKPATIARSYVLEAVNDQPARLVVELEEATNEEFIRSLPPEARSEPVESWPPKPGARPQLADASAQVVTPQIAAPPPPPPQIAMSEVAAPQVTASAPSVEVHLAEAPLPAEPRPQPVETRPAAPPQLATVTPAAGNVAPPPADTRLAAGGKARVTGGAHGPDLRPVVVIDPGHGGIDNGTQANGESEKKLVLAFSLMLRDRLKETGKYRVVMTRDRDVFIPLDKRVKVGNDHKAALFISIHADALPQHEGDAQGGTIYTVSDKASDADAERLAESENRVDLLGHIKSPDPVIVDTILMDLMMRETRVFSSRFANILLEQMKTAVRMHKQPLKSAGFRVLRSPSVPSVLVELGYVSNKDDRDLLVSEDWRTGAVAAMVKAVNVFLGSRANAQAPEPASKDGAGGTSAAKPR